MTIKKNYVTRTVTEDEVALFAKEEMEPFNIFRQDSKSCNFGILFGVSYRKFSNTSIEPKWSLERAEKFIEDKNLYDLQAELREKCPDEPMKKVKFYTVAAYLIDQFFTTYPGLKDRIERNKAFANENGYIRSFHGGIRRLPLLMWAIDPETHRTRKDENFKEIANLYNITANTSIQDDEVSTMNLALIRQDKQQTETVSIVGMVHDSADMYLARYKTKEECIKTLQEIQANFELSDEEWQKDIKFLVDIQIVDFRKEGHYYKHGEKLSSFSKNP